MRKQKNLQKNVCEVISNYCTGALSKTLKEYGAAGYKIVSVVMAKNQYGVEVMYLFFTLDE